MTCQTCGEPVSTTDCLTCGTPAGAPATTPGVKTFGVRGVGTAAAVLVGLTVLADVFAYLTPVVGGGLISGPDDVDGAVAAVLYEGLTSGAALIALLGAAVLVIVWTYRAHRNLDAFPGAYPAMRHGWAIAGWLIPFANLVLPFRVMSDVVRGSRPRGRVAGLVGVWWGAFLVSGIGGNYVGRSSQNLPYPETADDVAAYADAYAGQVVLSLVVLAASVVAGALLVVLITRVSAAQEARIQRAGPGTVLPGMAYPAGPTAHPAPPGVAPPAPLAAPPPPLAAPSPAPLAPPPREPGEPAPPGGATIGS